MAKYAIIKDDIVLNLIEWDGKSEWSPPEGTELVRCDDAQVSPDDIRTKDGFVAPDDVAKR